MHSLHECPILRCRWENRIFPLTTYQNLLILASRCWFDRRRSEYGQIANHRIRGATSQDRIGKSTLYQMARDSKVLEHKVSLA